jgi:hypothetical protein
MNLKTAETYLPCFRPGKPIDARTMKAARTAEKDEQLRERLKEQTQFDEQLVAAIHSIEPPADLQKRLSGGGAGAATAPSLRSQLGHPAMLSAVAGILLIIGFLVYQQMDRMQAFRGREAVERMLATTNDMSGIELEPTQGLAGDLSDAFYMRGFEGFAVAPPVAKLPVVGSRVFKQNGYRVAQLAVDYQNVLLFIFRASDFGVDLGSEGQWRIVTHHGWVAAVRADKGLCTMITFRGDRPRMQQFISSLPK